MSAKRFKAIITEGIFPFLKLAGNKNPYDRSVGLNIIQSCLVLLIIIAGVVYAGCGRNDAPAVPSLPDQTTSQPGLTGNADATLKGVDASSHYLLAYNLIYVDPEAPDGPKIEVIPVREGEIHLNILKFLEDGPCVNCFRIVGFNIPAPGIFNVNIQIDHPFDDLDFSVFDVRGIIMFQGGLTFPAFGKTISDPNQGDGVLLNPDGYTALYNISTIPAPIGDLQKYYSGNLASPIIPNSDINGYRYFITDNPANNRNAFYANSSDVQTFSLKLPTGPFVIGYAVDANWWTPIETPVDDPLSDFDNNANCPEPWKVVVTEVPIAGGLTNAGGQTKLLIDVYDWQGKSTFQNPVVECPELHDGSLAATWLEDGADYSRFEIIVSNDKLATSKDYLCLIGVEANENNPITNPWLDLTAYQVIKLRVNQPSPLIGWANAWGGIKEDYGYAVVIDDFNNCYVAGSFMNVVDFDPSDTSTDNHSATGGADDRDIFLSKFSIDGQHQWTRTWGGSLPDEGEGIAADSYGNIYVTGYFRGTVDFDPGPGSAIGISVGYTDAFLSKFNPTGEFLWFRAWGGNNNYYGDDGRSIAISDTDFVYVTGLEITSSYGNQAYLRKFNTQGTSIGNTLMWGGTHSDWGNDVAVDSSHNVFVTGGFEGTGVDFDPGPGNDYRNSNGGSDIFISKFDGYGKFLWVYTWGGSSYHGEWGTSLSLNSGGEPFVTGKIFSGQGYDDVFLCKFSQIGGPPIWTRIWGESNYGDDLGRSVVVSNSGDIYVCGWFINTVDFDPSPIAEDIHSTKGYSDTDAFLSKFDTDGGFIWARTWGGCDHNLYDGSQDVETDSEGNIYVSGYFMGLNTDLDPGAGAYYRTSNGMYDVFLSKFKSNGTW